MAKQLNEILTEPTEVIEKGNCKIHGEFETKVHIVMGRKLGGNCPNCLNERAEKARLSKEIMDYENMFFNITRAFSEYSLPPRFKNKSFNDYQADCEGAKKALITCKKYSELFSDRLEAGGGLVFCGTAGTGKTHLASSIINKIEESRYISVFMSALAATRHVKSTYNRDSQKSESEAIRDFIGPDLLVLDEVGVQFGTEAEKIILFEIINLRYQQVKPTILISNLTITELSEYIGERVIDRMYEGGGAVLSFDWDSYRRSK